MMKSPLKQLSKNMKLLRTTHNMSQNTLAEKINIARSTYSTYETGAKIPDLQTIDAISALYDVGFESLMNHDLSDGLMYKIYVEPEDEHLAKIMNSYQQLSVVSKKLLLERMDVLLERESIFYMK